MMERRQMVIIHLLIALVLLALISFLPAAITTTHHHRRKRKKMPPPPAKPPTTLSSWEQLKSLLSCRSAASSRVHDPSRLCGSSICGVAHSNTRVVHRPDTDHQSARSDDTAPLARRHHTTATSKGGMQLRKLSGCYECHAISVEPLSRYPRPRTLCACSDCGEVFTKPDSLELHRTLRHAVSELGPEDSGRNIVEIIFKSSWQKEQRRPMCVIDRILKVHNAPRTVARFEDYRLSVKSRHQNPAAAAASRCAADGNELLRFHCTTLACALGARCSTALCDDNGNCGACGVIRHGFGRTATPGVGTTASSGRAHDRGPVGRRAMLVCRVIAGRVRSAAAADEDGGGWFDSVAGGANLEELFVANPRAILPCFVVVYTTLE